jgi:uncharacterized membrane protein
MTASNIILFATTICAALMAGVFFSYSSSVVPGLKVLGNAEYIGAMQSINKAIQNPIFFIVFFGIILLYPICTYIHFSNPATTRFWLILSAAIVYFVGVFSVTLFGNIPLNNTLEKFNLLKATSESIALQRSLFENKWNALNTIRTISSFASLALIIIACISAHKNV